MAQQTCYFLFPVGKKKKNWKGASYQSKEEEEKLALLCIIQRFGIYMRKAMQIMW